MNYLSTKPCGFKSLNSYQIGVLLMVGFVCLVASDPTYANAATPGSTAESKIAAFFTGIRGIFQVIGVSVAVIGISFSFFQVIFGKKQFVDTLPVLLACVGVGSATVLADWLIVTNT